MNNNNYSANLTRLFHSYTPMSNSKSRRPGRQVANVRTALNRAVFALKQLKEARRLHAQLTRNIPKLEREYYKLVRRAGLHHNANMRSGPLTPNNLYRARHVAAWTKHIGSTMRLLKRTPLNHPLAERIARASAP